MSGVSPEQITAWNAELAGKSPSEITRWAVDLAAKLGGPVVVSTNFRPYEAVILHLATQAKADIPVLWVDHGYNRPATYRHAEDLGKQLGLNLKAYTAGMALCGSRAYHLCPQHNNRAGVEACFPIATGAKKDMRGDRIK